MGRFIGFVCSLYAEVFAFHSAGGLRANTQTPTEMKKLFLKLFAFPAFDKYYQADNKSSIPIPQVRRLTI